ncbi:gamma-glutamyltransferase [Pseudonocardia spinosispora]|uniref:gamma-glutamyltransferase family protein n=1 Tax=Pseudonocardia spinosispora TaxID=103441 RepID=UPI0006863019
MAASTHWLASSTAMSVLERGGNAFDAAAAAGFVLQVVEPHMNGPAGEVPALLWDAREGTSHLLCGQGVAPSAATPARFRELGLKLVPGTGLLAATVPGSFGAWTLMVQRWGTWSLADVLDYAIGYCERGYPSLPAIHATVSRVATMFTDYWPTSAAAWLRGGEVPDVGAVLTSPVLGRTYQRIVAEASARSSDREQQFEAARDIWYRGWVADLIDRFCSRTSWLDTSGRTNSGLLTGDDMASWEPTVERPKAFDYGRYQVLKTDLWGQGPVFGQQLALLEGLGLDEAGYGSPDYLHAVIEASKLAFADREAWYGEGGVGTLDGLLDPGYTTQRRSLIGATASMELRPGSPGGREPRLPELPGPADMEMLAQSLIAGAGEPTLRANGLVAGDTCHLDVVDAAGNMVSATPSGGWLQSSPVVPELGFALGTRAQMFWLDEGLPNSLRPRARPRTTLSPSLAMRDGEPWMAFGTPGGDQQDQWSLHFFLAMVHGGLGMQEAIDAPAIHSEHFPSSFYPRSARTGHVVLEERFPASVRDELSRRGHNVDIAGPWTLGRLSAVAREPDHLAAAANPRGAQGYAVGR